MTDRLPLRANLEGEDIQLRLMTPGDADAVLAFAKTLPTHELLFLPRDIRQPKVAAAWAREAEEGRLATILAIKGDVVVGCGAVARDPLSWSAHVAEIRAVLATEARGRGLGTLLVQETFRLALLMGAEKLLAQMTTDQPGAIAIFEGLGFTPEAILREQVRDSEGQPHDILVLSHLVAEVASRLTAYGVGEPGS